MLHDLQYLLCNDSIKKSPSPCDVQKYFVLDNVIIRCAWHISMQRALFCTQSGNTCSGAQTLFERNSKIKLNLFSKIKPNLNECSHCKFHLPHVLSMGTFRLSQDKIFFRHSFRKYLLPKRKIFTFDLIKIKRIKSRNSTRHCSYV